MGGLAVDRLISSTEGGKLTCVDFIYTRHVRLRMQQRGLSRRLIETTVRFADRRLPSFRGRTTAQKRVGNKTLEVVYKKLNDHTVVITAYWLEEGV